VGLIGGVIDKVGVRSSRNVVIVSCILHFFRGTEHCIEVSKCVILFNFQSRFSFLKLFLSFNHGEFLLLTVYVKQVRMRVCSELLLKSE
jgi:hypothetical protein